MAIIKCPECGKEISDQATHCPICNHQMIYPSIAIKKDIGSLARPTVRKGTIFFIIGIVFLIGALAILLSSRYTFYKDLMDTCAEEYEKAMELVDESKDEQFGKYYGYSYQNIADDWLNMADDARTQLLHYRITIGVFSALGATCLAIGGTMLLKSKKRSVVSQK